MVMLMLLVHRKKLVSEFVVTSWLSWLGWASTAVLALCIVGMGITPFV